MCEIIPFPGFGSEESTWDPEDPEVEADISRIARRGGWATKGLISPLGQGGTSGIFQSLGVPSAKIISYPGPKIIKLGREAKFP